MRTKLTLILLAISMGTLLAQPDQRIALTPKVNYDWRPGFVSITEAAYAFGLSETSIPLSKYYYGITTQAGYQFTRNIKAGVGAGVHRHNEGTLFPLFVDARYSFSAQEIVPYISAAGGLAINPEDPVNQTWLYINPSAGIRYVAANKVGVSFSAGIIAMSGGTNRNTFLNFRLGLELKGKK